MFTQNVTIFSYFAQAPPKKKGKNTETEWVLIEFKPEYVTFKEN